MKIAILGSAGSVQLAPFKNSDYDNWVQGKAESLARAHGQIPGDFDIWGCSPGCWAVSPRFTRFFEVHRWQPGAPWFSPEYCQFLRDFKGPVYTGARIDEIQNHVVYPIDRIEEKFASYSLTSSISLMLALAIDEIEQIRAARRSISIEKAQRLATGSDEPMNLENPLPNFVDTAELAKPDDDDVIGLWGIDMSAGDEYAYQRPGAQWLVIEAMRRGIGVYLPPESELMRPMPIYGISEWDHNYIKLTTRSRELNAKITGLTEQLKSAERDIHGAQGEMQALNYFVSTWTSPYGMMPGLILRQVPGTGLGSGVTQIDARPVERMTLGGPELPAHKPVLDAMTANKAGPDLLSVLAKHCDNGEVGEDPERTLHIALTQRAEMASNWNKMIESKDKEIAVAKAKFDAERKKARNSRDALRKVRSR